MQSEFPSTLWRVSEFEERYLTVSSASGTDSRLMSTSMMSELNALQRRQCDGDVVEVLAACRRVQEPVLIYMRLDELVWPITVFPGEGVYHSRHDLLRSFGQGIANLEVVAMQSASMVPPALRARERGGNADFFRPLRPALWQMAMSNPNPGLLREIGGTAAYRALRSLGNEGLPTQGAVGHAAERLHREAASLRHIAQWPGMSIDRAVRLLNGLYLVSNLMISRSHPQARAEPSLAAPGRPARLGRP